MMDQGQMNVGPLLIARGTASSAPASCPRSPSGEHTWCQGYSELNAGSDLASHLRTEARIEGDEFVINGQKIWSSVAFDATHVRAGAYRQDGEEAGGISFVMIDMRQPALPCGPSATSLDTKNCARCSWTT